MRVAVLLALILILSACSSEQPPQEPAASSPPRAAKPAPPTAPVDEPVPPPTVLATPLETVTPEGLTMITYASGNGAVAGVGKKVSVHYTGWLQDPAAADGKGDKFDSSRDRGQPFQFVLGLGQVIRGWDKGIDGMRVGGKRTLIIPSDLAYGDRGRPPVIPPKSTLIFDVELMGVKQPEEK